jgi:TRAP-type mannitol/chloroaromatic compound transport system permease large subunit
VVQPIVFVNLQAAFVSRPLVMPAIDLEGVSPPHVKP